MIFPDDLRLGYYVYKDRIYFNRELIYDDMYLNEDWDAKISYVFNEDVFNKADWYNPIPISILDLYKVRAIQLRQKYNYLILMFSGGSDSVQILHSFVKNNIMLDEIRIMSIDKAVQSVGENNFSSEEFNYVLEYKYAAFKILDEIKELIPNTKINHVDVTDQALRELITKKYSFFQREDYSGLGMAAKNIRTCSWYGIRYATENHISDSCLIYGLEKPIISINLQNYNLKFQFSDATMREFCYARDFSSHNYVRIEPFYWTRDLPLIPIKQSQIIKRALSENPQLQKQFVLNTQKRNELSFDQTRDLIAKSSRMFDHLIYPNWKPSTFSGSKPRIIRPEVKALEMLLGKTTPAGIILDENQEFKAKRYAKLKNRIPNGSVLSEPYPLGSIPKII
jgi:hypothetical protein